MADDPKDDAPAIHIEFASIVGQFSRKGLVEMKVEKQIVLLTLDKAREIHGMLGGAIEAAITDELLVRFLIEKIHMSLETAVLVLRDFRIMRQGSPDTVYPH